MLHRSGSTKALNIATYTTAAILVATCDYISTRDKTLVFFQSSHADPLRFQELQLQALPQVLRPQVLPEQALRVRLLQGRPPRPRDRNAAQHALPALAAPVAGQFGQQQLRRKQRTAARPELCHSVRAVVIIVVVIVVVISG